LGAVNFENIEYWNVIKSIEEWMALDIRPYDDFIHTVSGPIRIPSVVICSDYKGIMNIKAKFPTKQNIWERDNYTCVYTGEKLNRTTLSIDHVIPKSKGGGSTWENLVTCQRILNSNKGSKTLKEAKLKLRYKPFKPVDGHQFNLYKQEWHSFVANM
jgi:5-methylcytosine-specific restriction endonuclease McrA